MAHHQPVLKKTLAFGMLAGLMLLQVAQAARVTVTIAGVLTADGLIMAALADRSAGFPQKFTQANSVRAQIPSVTLTFENVEPGRYAMSVYHDRNGNGKLDVGAFGIPKEPYGFSRDARAVMGPPAFDDAAFDVPAEGLSLVIHLK